MWAFIRCDDVVAKRRQEMMKRARSSSELQAIPGVGPSIAADLNEIGITRMAQLKRADPEELYRRSNEQKGVLQDRCLLYVFRCAVYYASRPVHEPEKLKWWNWKDRS